MLHLIDNLNGRPRMDIIWELFSLNIYIPDTARHVTINDLEGIPLNDDIKRHMMNWLIVGLDVFVPITHFEDNKKKAHVLKSFARDVMHIDEETDAIFYIYETTIDTPCTRIQIDEIE